MSHEEIASQTEKASLEIVTGINAMNQPLNIPTRICGL